ncbi:hypothetical protein F7Q99_39045 [Streptomyces kaniharaensis]|uniref:Uncharacterized protein n=1 Tax=Streptomyces kaniharaensis TaxID=212423 RepID=A0A6N7L2L1_9ACTN|nr:hypothetical protein [Streptomyces kaniharaensis]MQS18030.1 hypothetical protein [Streptomyces kaniharaensis]
MTEQTKTEFNPDDRHGYSRKALARVVLSEDAAEAARSALNLVRTDQREEPYDVIGEALNLVNMAEAVLKAAVVWARENHTSWEDIGEAVGGITRQSAHTRYAEAESEWKLGLVEPIIPPPADRPRALASQRLHEAAYQPTDSIRRLDAWAAEHGLGQRAISRNLPELTLMDELGNVLDAISHATRNPHRVQGEERARLLDRKAALLDRIAAEQNRPESAELAAGARAKAAEIRAELATTHEEAGR